MWPLTWPTWPLTLTHVTLDLQYYLCNGQRSHFKKAFFDLVTLTYDHDPQGRFWGHPCPCHDQNFCTASYYTFEDMNYFLLIWSSPPYREKNANWRWHRQPTFRFWYMKCIDKQKDITMKQLSLIWNKNISYWLNKFFDLSKPRTLSSLASRLNHSAIPSGPKRHTDWREVMHVIPIKLLGIG